MTFNEVLDRWLQEKKVFVKESTFAYYSFEAKNYIVPVLGTIKMEDITEECIQKAVLVWQSKGMDNGRPLNKSTVQNLVMLIKQVLKFAVRKGMINEYVVQIRFVPQNRSNLKKKVFSTEEQNILIQASLSELSYKTFGILLCINSGLRIGELCALKWEDIEFQHGIIHVTKTLQRIYMQNQTPRTQIIIGEPKTSSSIRDIPLAKKIFQIIESFSDLNKKGYVLTNNNQFMEPRTFRKFYANFLQQHKINPLNFHCLRHTFATRCIENGADYKSVSEILGHTTINTTLNMYVHPQMEEKRKCVELIHWE